jgi:hypothetical protein
MRDSLQTLRQLAKLLGARRQGRPTHTSTLLRWNKNGLRGKRLILTRVGGIWMGSPTDLRQFIEATQPIQPSTSPDTVAVDSTDEDEELDQELDRDAW